MIDKLRNHLALGDIARRLSEITIKIKQRISGFMFGSFADVIGSRRHKHKHSVHPSLALPSNLTPLPLEVGLSYYPMCNTENPVIPATIDRLDLHFSLWNGHAVLIANESALRHIPAHISLSRAGIYVPCVRERRRSSPWHPRRRSSR